VTGRRALDDALGTEAEALARAGLARTPLGKGPGIDLVSNDYLALARDPRVVGAAQAALARDGLGAGASRLLGGDRDEHRRLEEDLAALQHEAAGVLFASGGAANLGLLVALAGPEDLVVSDAGNHATLVDGIRLCGARRVIVRRGDPDAVHDALLRAPATRRRFVVVEGVHGMDGDLAPLAALADVCRRDDALLVVDEAHALGLVGPEGAGAVAAAGCEDVCVARVNPCGKALGGAGGVVTGSAALAAALHARARTFVFGTALPPSVAAGVREALRIARADTARRARPVTAARRFERAMGFDRAGGGALVPVVLGATDDAMRAAAGLTVRGFEVRAVRPPTVPEGTSRLRLSFHADHADDVPERLAAGLRELVGASRP
jgi:8-amino-7-oxononanoate synthase